MWIYPDAVGGMLAVAAAIYVMAKWSNASKMRSLPFWMSLSLLLLYLGFFKYFKQFAALGGLTGFEELLLPIGISYFSFKLIHFAIEVKRGNFPDITLEKYGVFLFLAPIFTSGPINRYDQTHAARETAFRWQMAEEGLQRITYGLIKKFIFVTVITIALERVMNAPDVPTFINNLDSTAPWRIWGFLILMYLFVYMDFSAYSDVAIGASRLFGFRIIENFNYPFLATDIGNHWKRWHISLSTWCQTYIYLPAIGFTRNPYLAVMCSFTVMGLWHAASWNYLFWGWYNAAGIIVFQFWSQYKRKRKLTFADKGPLRFVKYPMTFLFFSGSFAFSATHGIGNITTPFILLARGFGV